MQLFQWGDYTAKPRPRYQFGVVPVYGEPKRTVNSHIRSDTEWPASGMSRHGITWSASHDQEATALSREFTGCGYVRGTSLYFTLAEMAAMWRISREKARRLFHNEPGVMCFHGLKNNVREYNSYRVPESVARRVRLRLMNR